MSINSKKENPGSGASHLTIHRMCWKPWLCQQSYPRAKLHGLKCPLQGPHPNLQVEFRMVAKHMECRKCLPHREAKSYERLWKTSCPWHSCPFVATSFTSRDPTSSGSKTGQTVLGHDKWLRGGLKHTRGWALFICKYCKILCQGIAHNSCWYMRDPGANSP